MWTAAVAFLVAVAGSGRPAAADSDGIWTNPGRVYPAALPIADASSENPRCRQDSRLLLDGLRDETLWASKSMSVSLAVTVHDFRKIINSTPPFFNSLTAQVHFLLRHRLHSSDRVERSFRHFSVVTSFFALHVMSASGINTCPTTRHP